MFKIAYGAGHNLYTAGKRLDKALDPAETREWVLNDRVARYFAEAAAQYEDVELLRVDDPTGKTNVNLHARCARANKWKADFCLAIHHNAGVKLGRGGGIVAYSCPGSDTGAKYRDAIYEACIDAGGLKGNRSTPKQAYGYYVLKNTDAPAVLMEYGFMDSKTDAPVILTEVYSKLVAYATMDGIAMVKGLKKKPVVNKPTSDEDNTDNMFEYSLKSFIKDIQGAFGAKVDGIAGPETLSKTQTISAKKLNRHKAVRFIQKRLRQLGYAEIGIIDGVAGPKFTSAVAHFQQDNDCAVDGEITAGNKTWKKLLGMA